MCPVHSSWALLRGLCPAQYTCSAWVVSGWSLTPLSLTCVATAVALGIRSGSVSLPLAVVTVPATTSPPAVSKKSGQAPRCLLCAATVGVSTMLTLVSALPDPSLSGNPRLPALLPAPPKWCSGLPLLLSTMLGQVVLRHGQPPPPCLCQLARHQPSTYPAHLSLRGRLCPALLVFSWGSVPPASCFCWSTRLHDSPGFHHAGRCHALHEVNATVKAMNVRLSALERRAATPCPGHSLVQPQPASAPGQSSPLPVPASAKPSSLPALPQPLTTPASPQAASAMPSLLPAPAQPLPVLSTSPPQCVSPSEVESLVSSPAAMDSDVEGSHADSVVSAVNISTNYFYVQVYVIYWNMRI